MSDNNSFDLEAREVTLYEVKESVPAKEGKKPTTRSLGFARTEEHAKVIVDGLRNEGKISKRDAILMKKKSEDETDAVIYLQGKAVDCIFHIANFHKIPLDQFRVFTKDQQRYLTLIGESAENGEAAEEE